MQTRPDHAFLHRLLGLTLVTVTLAACESLRWDYQIANGGDEGETAQYKPDGLLPGLEPGEAVAFCRYKEANEAQGPFASNVVEISVHDPRPGGSGTTSQALGTGFTVAGGGAGESTQGYGRGGTFEGGGRGEWTEGGGRGEWKEGHGQGAAVEPQPLVVHAHVDDPRVFRRGENFRLLFDCKNTGHHTVTEVVLINRLDNRLLVLNPEAATVTEDKAGSQVRWRRKINLAPGDTTRFQLTCRVRLFSRNKKVLN